MDKLQMAHEWAMKHGSEWTFDTVLKAWEYADAMQAEADKRNKAEAEEKSKQIRELLKADNTFIEKEGQHFDDVEWQPDWSQAPFDCDWFAVDLDGSAYFYSYKPYIKDGYTFWGDPDITNDGHSCEVESNFGYTGNWQDSLRKRPHGF